MRRYMTEAQIDKAARQAAGRIAMTLWMTYRLTTDGGKRVKPSSRDLLRMFREHVGECVRLNAKSEKR